MKLKAVKVSQLKRVNVDTAVQEKKSLFPTDARLTLQQFSGQQTQASGFAGGY